MNWNSITAKQWLAAWGILYGGCLVISETFDPKLGEYLAIAFTASIVLFSPVSFELGQYLQGKINGVVKV